MARIERQLTIWSELERELPPGLEELLEFLDTLGEHDEELVRELERQRWRIGENGERKQRGKGRDDFPVRAMWNLLATALFLRNGKLSEALAELRRNSDLARLLGFTEIGPNQYQLPSSSALSRFHVKLKKDNGGIREIFNKTVRTLAEENPEFGEHTAVDASDTRTHARARRVKKSDLTEQEREEFRIKLEEVNDVPDSEGGQSEGKGSGKDNVTISSDKDASWSMKSKTYEDKDGKKEKKTKGTYGYKTYFDTDTTIPGVVSVEVETGSYSDQKKAVPIVEDGKDRLPEGRRKTVALDKGFDSEENVRGVWDLGIAPIVPARGVPKKIDELPQADRELQLSPGSNIVRDKYTGEVACYDLSENSDEDPTRRTMTYAGAELDRSAHKFRCPLGARAEQECPFFQSCSAGPAGSLGRQVRVPFETDIRRFAPIYPQSARWKRLYNGRSAVERINSYAKEVLPLERHALRGKKAIELRALLTAITINVRTINSLRRAKSQAIAA